MDACEGRLFGGDTTLVTKQASKQAFDGVRIDLSEIMGDFVYYRTKEALEGRVYSLRLQMANTS